MNAKDIHRQYRQREEKAARPPNLLKWALAYALRGYFVFPLHNPIFDDAGKCTGCTCEEWKRTQPDYGPDFKCDQPGKCPRVKWSEKSTIDEAMIRRWWGKPWRDVDVETGKAVWNLPNIGIDCGKSGLLVIDADNYKENFAGDDLHLDDNTITSLTGGGGRHLWYRQPEGKAYGNAEGDLPAGINVRGAGGYIVAPISLHKSGRRYEFAQSRSPANVDPLPLPQFLIDILEAAQTSRGAADVRFSERVGDAPDLAQWSISADILELIRNGHPVGSDRSAYDQKVITALIYAGASDDKIRAVFVHFPIGAKYREKKRTGDKYLGRSIGKAHVYVEDHPRDSQPDQSIMSALRALRTWAQGPDLAESLRDRDIARPADYITTLIAIINRAIQRGAQRVLLSSRQLGELTNSSHMTAKRHLAMFGDGITINHEGGTVTHRPGLSLLTVSDDPAGYGKWIDLTDLLRTVTLLNLPPTMGECNSSQQFADDHLQDEAFVQYPRHLALKMRPNAEILPYGLNAAALLIAAVLFQCGELTHSAICRLTGLSEYTVRKMLRRMADMGLVMVWRGKPYRYELHPSFEVVLDDLRPLLPSYEITKRRRWVNAGARVTFINRQLNAPEPPDARSEAKLKARREKCEKQKDDLAQAAAVNGLDITIKLAEHRPPKKKIEHREHLDRLRRLHRHGERVDHRLKRCRYKPKSPNVSIFAADVEWEDFNAWAVMTYGSGWWVRRDVNGILLGYEQYLAAQDYVPTMHWTSETAVAA